MKDITIRLITEDDLKDLADVYAETYNAANIHEHWSTDAALRLMKYLYADQLYFSSSR